MFILLPNYGDFGLHSLERRLSSELIFILLDSLKKERVKVPKLKCSLYLMNTLYAMGASKDESKADLPGMMTEGELLVKDDQ